MRRARGPRCAEWSHEHAAKVPAPYHLRLLSSLVLAPLLWAIPFALFFGTLTARARPHSRLRRLAGVRGRHPQRDRARRAGARTEARRRAGSGGYPWLSTRRVYMAVSVTHPLAAIIGPLPRARLPRLATGLAHLGHVRGRIRSARGRHHLRAGVLPAGVSRAVALERMQAELARAELRALAPR